VTPCLASNVAIAERPLASACITSCPARRECGCRTNPARTLRAGPHAGLQRNSALRPAGDVNDATVFLIRTSGRGKSSMGVNSRSRGHASDVRTPKSSYPEGRITGKRQGTRRGRAPEPRILVCSLRRGVLAGRAPGSGHCGNPGVSNLNPLIRRCLNSEIPMEARPG